MNDTTVPTSNTVCLHRPKQQTSPARNHQPRLLDLFCGEGGAALGYQQAGFTVTGVDHQRSRGRHYPGQFVHDDALDYLAGHAHQYDVIHASPPCQAYSITKHSHHAEHPDLLAPTRDALNATGLPYVIENVVGAPLITPVLLCGSYFDLTAIDTDGTRLVLRRHRLFESNVWLWPTACYCLAYKDKGYLVGGIYGGGSSTRDRAKERRGGYTPAKHIRAELLGIPDGAMTWDGLAQALPPAYTHHVGQQLIEHVHPTDGLDPPGQQLHLPFGDD